MSETKQRLKRECEAIMGPVGEAMEEPVILYSLALDEIAKLEREIDLLRAFCRGMAINIENMLK